MRDTSATVLFSESQANPTCLGIRGWSGRFFRLFRTPNHCCVAFLVLFLLGLVQPGLAATDENLVQDPGLQVQGENATLQHWETGRSEVPGVTRSRFQVGEPAEGTGRMLGIWGGRDRAGIWAGNLKGVKPYTDYLLCFTVYRKQAVNGMYPSVRIFGQTCRLNQAWFTRRLHQVELVLNSGPSAGRERLIFANPYPLWIWFGRPAVKELSWKNRKKVSSETAPGGSKRAAGLNSAPARSRERFPLGLYGTGIEDYPKIAETPFWLVKAPPTPKAVNKAHSLGLNVFCRMPHGEQKLSTIEAAFGQEGFGQDDFFYIDDEPELRSVDPARLQAVRSRLREIWPRVRGAVANVRPRFVQTYRQAAEIL